MRGPKRNVKATGRVMTDRRESTTRARTVIRRHAAAIRAQRMSPDVAPPTPYRANA